MWTCALTLSACAAGPVTLGPTAPAASPQAETQASRSGGASPAATDASAQALTVYNQGFAVVRDRVPLTLKPGDNEIRYSGMTAHLEPDSVILRDPTGALQFQIREQNYRNDPVTQQRLLQLYEGQTIDFLRTSAQGDESWVKGRVIRSGYQPPVYDAYGNQMYRPDQQPVIEVDGLLRFQLPGVPVFPALRDDTILQPTLNWKIQAATGFDGSLELAYVTGGMSWHADYNVVAPEIGDRVDFVGWVTVDNRTGRDFVDARIKLLAGDVNKLASGAEVDARSRSFLGMAKAEAMAPVVTEKSFDEYHLYTLAHPTTLRDAQLKQVEFVRATGVPAKRLYVYDGAALNTSAWQGWNPIQLRAEPGYGTESNPKVWVMREFRNDAASGLGIPLPKGRLRFYRQDDDRRLEFTGENQIDHTPKDETIRVYTGNSFDLVGERVRTDFKLDSGAKWLDETFEITLRNHKSEAVEIRVVEHLYRWKNWELRNASQESEKTESQTIEFRAQVPADGEHKIRYLVHYTW